MFFFFFYYGLEDEPVIREAFRQICAEKLFSDLYCDMDEYLSARISKREMRRMLEEEGSVFADLYKNAYPTEDQAYTKWKDIRGKYEEAKYADWNKRRIAAETDEKSHKEISCGRITGGHITSSWRHHSSKRLKQRRS